jgi:hypothetical protein
LTRLPERIRNSAKRLGSSPRLRDIGRDLVGPLDLAGRNQRPYRLRKRFSASRRIREIIGGLVGLLGRLAGVLNLTSLSQCTRDFA